MERTHWQIHVKITETKMFLWLFFPLLSLQLQPTDTCVSYKLLAVTSSLELNRWNANKGPALFLTWPRGNCLISNFGKVPDREGAVHSWPPHQISHVFTAHGGSAFFPPPAIVLLNSCQDKSEERLAGCQASLPLHTGMCVHVHVCLGTCCSRGHSQGRRGKIWKKQELLCVLENQRPRRTQKRRLNKTADVLLELKCGRSSLLWLNPAHRGPVNTWFAPLNQT